MGNFINTNYMDTLDFITDSSKDLIKKGIYLYNDKKSLKCEYYHINSEESTLDEAARIPYSDLGPNCPFRFDVIHGFLLFGNNKVELSMENGDVGLESGDITGEFYVLPNTIVPYPGDYFEISQIDKASWLFRVNGVEKDTLDNGVNGYQIQYKLEHTDHERILPLIIREYNFLVNQVGTEYSSIIECKNYEMIDKMDQSAIKLKRYYRELFYDSKTQTFLNNHIYESYLYDAYMIEFLIRNKIMANIGQKDYIYVEHKLTLPNTFQIDYEKHFLYSLEMRDTSLLKKSNRIFIASQIDNVMSIFNKRPEVYFAIANDTGARDPFHMKICCMDDELKDRILFEDYYDAGDDKEIYNLIIKFYWNRDFNDYDLDLIDNIDFQSTIDIFYLVPSLIYCLERGIKDMLNSTYK